jgi:predicted secreted hydrolase
MRRRTADIARVAALGVLVAACSGPILANPTLAPVVVATPSVPPSRAPDPQPIVFPRDDGPHDRLTEWWYYTGHLADATGHHWGFEFVVFRAERGGFPVSWASHVALTDETAGTFSYAQRAAVGPHVSGPLRDPLRFNLYLVDTSGARPWAMAGSSVGDALQFSLDPTEADPTATPVGLNLELRSAKPSTLHGDGGWIDFGPAGGSYYYSKTHLDVSGSVKIGGDSRAVTGIAWFDHQWGDFISVGAGGWDWFAVNLADGTDLTISQVRAADGTYPLVYGTLVDADGKATHLDRTAFEIAADPARTWTSPATGAEYPAAWTIRVPGENLVIKLRPTVADQELDTRATTGVAYWEGSQVVSATRGGRPVAGEAYVELTGYAPEAP